MKPERTLAAVIDALESAGIAYMLTGALAGSYHGVPRSTQDIDLVVDATEAQLLQFARSLPRDRFYVEGDAVREAVAHRGQFNVIDMETAWKVDLILRKDRAFSRTEFSRRTREEALGLPLWLARAEDVILAKLEWAKLTESERQLDDAVGIVRCQPDLDRDYVRAWAAELSVEEQWRRVLRRAAQS